MLLAARGFNVTMFDTHKVVGGRNAPLYVGHTRFDTGPTILVMKFILDLVFKESKRNSDDYLKFTRLHPMYRLQYGPDKYIDCYDVSQKEKMIEEMRRVFPKDVDAYSRYIEYERSRYDKVMPLLQRPFLGYHTMMYPDAIKSLPHITLGKSMHNLVGKYFGDPLAKISFSFQSKYLGMTPWECPAVLGILPYVEHAYGCWHTEGGMSEISNAMAKVFSEHGGQLKLGTPVQQLILDGRKVKGVRTAEGEHYFDEVVMNADFANSINKLVPNAEEILKSWKPSKIAKKSFSCSTFMYYVALDKFYPELQHHTISFADDYQNNMTTMGKGVITDDFTLYIRNATINDATLSPKGKSGLYIMIFVPNLISSKTDWGNAEVINTMKEKAIKHIATRCGIKDLRDHIEAEHIITPNMWRDNMNVYQGAIFSLSHSFFQMLSFRPRNKFHELDNLYLVGGSTHPGSGLPVIWESARITSKLVCDKYGIDYEKVRFA